VTPPGPLGAVERPSVEELLDRAAITGLFVRYCTAFRLKDLSLLDAVFAGDAVIDYSRIGGSASDLTATKEWVAGVLAGVETFHLTVGDSEFVFAPDRRSASVTTTWSGLFAPKGDGAPLLIYGHYEDELVRRDEWLISKRVDFPEARITASPVGGGA
jgi:SnoaL-like domain